jgi:hypothetical protein
MRPTHSPLPRLVPTITLPSAKRREAAEKPATETKPPKKRSLNEAAHKLGY